MNIQTVKKALRKHADKKQAKILQRFFKTGLGEYAEGDIFLGIKVQVLRNLANKSQGLPLNMVIKLLKSPVHEDRLLALFILILKYRKEDAEGREKIYCVYLGHTKYINNWDLVDATAKHIVGAFLIDRDKAPLYKLAKSGSLWERRISILSTFYFIEHHKFEDTLKIAEALVLDKHDLIHKATGWMLREIGKRDHARERAFLKRFYRKMPRTMLRYAIERFPEAKRQQYLKR